MRHYERLLGATKVYDFGYFSLGTHNVFSILDLSTRGYHVAAYTVDFIQSNLLVYTSKSENLFRRASR